ncbi:hypothetical protein D3C81_1849020 [compost metagenome]
MRLPHCMRFGPSDFRRATQPASSIFSSKASDSSKPSWVRSRSNLVSTTAESAEARASYNTAIKAIASTKALPGCGTCHQRSYFTIGKAAVTTAPAKVIIQPRYTQTRKIGKAATAPYTTV